MTLVIINVFALTKLNYAHDVTQRQEEVITKTRSELQSKSHSLKRVESEMTTIDASLKQEREKAQGLEQENQSLKVNLQAKKERKASTEQTKPVQVIAQAAPVSGSCEDWLAQAGISDMANARILIQRESGCNPFADNPTSDAYGIPQALPGSKMASHGADWATNPVTQLKWMQSYVMGRYGSWANAVSHSYSVGWY